VLISWIALPLVLCALSAGCGLLLERISNQRLPGALVLPAGLAVIVVVGLFAVSSDSTAELATPAVVVLAAAGFALSPPWKRGRLDPWALGCAVAVFAAYAAPVALSGQPTFASYLPMVDAGSWFGLTEHVMNHGRNLSSVPASDYRNLLETYLPVGYPLGSFVPFGVVTKLLGQDPAWLFQPYLAFVSAMLALSLYGLSARFFGSAPRRAFAVLIASQPAVLYGAAHWSGVKELSAASVLALLGALIFPAVQERARGRKLLPICVASAATLGLLSFAGGIWLVPLLAGGLVLSVQLRGRDVAVAQAVAVLIITAVLSIPTLVEIGSFLSNSDRFGISGETKALLFHPLSWRQLFGIWPAGDFRATAGAIGLTNALVAVVVIAAVTGLVWAWRSRRWELVIYAGGSALACLVIAMISTPWSEAKAFEIASPAILIVAMAGALAIPSLVGRTGDSQYAQIARNATPVAGILVAGGVLWSNALAYSDVTLAPRPQLRELEQINERFTGQGPTLLTDYEPYAARHFLRDLDVDGTWPFRIPLGGGRSFLPEKNSLRIDTEAFDKPSLLDYRTIVRRHNPASSYPAAAYRLAWSGRYWEVWQRIPRPGRIVAHLALGGGGQPVGRPKCRDVLAIARQVGSNGVLAFSERPSLNEAELAPVPVWTSHTTGAAVPNELRSGVVKGSFDVPRTGRYGFWMSGTFYRRVQLRIDGKAVSKPRREWNFSFPNYVFVGASNLSRGAHSVEVHYGDEGSLHPGTGGHAAVAPGLGVAPLVQFGFGPLVFSRESPDWRVTYSKPFQARHLCGKTLDWVEAIEGGP
jgi:hypothetical protein